MAELTDLKNAYLIGIRDGFRLAGADETAEIEDLTAEIKNDFGAKMQPVRDELAARGCAVETERDPESRLN